MSSRGGRLSTSAGRQPRNAAQPSKFSRGGIQKRRSPAGALVDRDGDLNMNDEGARRVKLAAPAAPRGGSRGSRSTNRGGGRGGGRGISRAVQGIARRWDGDRLGTTAHNHNSGFLKYLRVEGLNKSKAVANEQGGRKDLVAFLERKAGTLSGRSPSRPILIKKCRAEGDFVWIGTSADDAEQLLKLDGFTFAGAILKISDESPAKNVRAKLDEVLAMRHFSSNKLLKLDALNGDKLLLGLGMFENPEIARKTFATIMFICESKFKAEDVQNISIADNSIDDVSQVETLATAFPKLKNLDLSRNHITALQGLRAWEGAFQHLETLYLTGNPIETTEPALVDCLLRMFPRLMVISGVTFRTVEQVAAQIEANKPRPIPHKGPDFRDNGHIGENFLLEFFQAFDHNRSGLASKYYDETSQFSLSVDTNAVRSPGAPPPQPWGSYLKFSRNLLKVTNPSTRMQRLLRGGLVIAEMWKNLPPTRHPDIKQEIHKYIMDCHPLPGLADPLKRSPKGVDGIIISVHGEFDEVNPATGNPGKRSFSRTFVLGPGLPGRHPIRVVSDMLALRAYSSLPNIHGLERQEGQDGQQKLVGQLCEATGMKPEYAKLCLEGAGWNYQMGLAMFHDRKEQLPIDAFTVPLRS